jgi:hypothetical protein
VSLASESWKMEDWRAHAFRLMNRSLCWPIALPPTISAPTLGR